MADPNSVFDMSVNVPEIGYIAEEDPNNPADPNYVAPYDPKTDPKNPDSPDYVNANAVNPVDNDVKAINKKAHRAHRAIKSIENRA